MKSARISVRGKRFSVITAFALSLGAFFLDPFVILLGAAMFLLEGYDYFESRQESRRKPIKFEEPGFTTEALRGDPVRFELHASCAREARFETQETAIVLGQPYLTEGLNVVPVELGSRLVGRYQTNSIGVWFSSRFGLIERRVQVPFSLDVRLYPRYLVAVAEAVEYAMEEGRGTWSEKASREVGRGLEYASTRKYEPTDEPRLIDWKASARFAELMVKEFFAERGSVNLAFDMVAPGPISHDEMATGFFNVLLATARYGVLGRVTMYGEAGLVLDIEEKDNRAAVTAAVNAVLDYDQLDENEVFGLLDIMPSPGRHNVPAIRRWFNERRQKGQRTGSMLVAKEGQRVVVTSLVRTGSKVYMELSDAGVKGEKPVVLYPENPWIDAQSLESAYLMHRRSARGLESLSRFGVIAVPLPLKAKRKELLAALRR